MQQRVALLSSPWQWHWQPDSLESGSGPQPEGLLAWLPASGATLPLQPQAATGSESIKLQVEVSELESDTTGITVTTEMPARIASGPRFSS